MTLPHLYFLFPRLNINSGGNIAQLKFLAIAQEITTATAVTYRQREKDTLFLDDLLKKNPAEDTGVYVIHWGPDIQRLLTKLKNRRVIYVAHSSGYRFTLPPKVPIIAVSKHTQAYWGRHAPNSLIFYLPNEISPEYQNRHQPRTIDILVMKRKSSKYLLEKLVPALKPHCNLVLVDFWVEDLAHLFNQTKVYLYDSSEYWWQTGLTEGFGLPPLEAMACGCTVFSSINDALSDYLDPGFNCHKLRVYSLEYDVYRILNAVKNWQDCDNDEFLQKYRKQAISERFKKILEQIDFFFSYQKIVEDSNIPGFSRALVGGMIGKIKKKIGDLVKR